MSIGRHMRSTTRRLSGTALLAAVLISLGCQRPGCADGARPHGQHSVDRGNAPSTDDRSQKPSSDAPQQPVDAPDEAADPADSASSPHQWSEGDGIDKAFTGHLARGDWRLMGFATSDTDSAETDDAGDGVDVIVARGGAALRRPIESCDGFFAAIRQHDSPRQSGPPDFELTLDFGRVRFQDRVIFDLNDQFCAPVEPGASPASADQITGSLRLLSQVGPIVTVESIESRSQKERLPRLSTQWSTIDLRTGQPAAWAALLDEQSLLEALQSASAVTQTNVADRVKRASTLEQAISAFENTWGVFGGWAFHSWDPDAGRAVIHVAYHTGNVRGRPARLSRMQLTVAPREQHRHLFDKARGGDQGFLMDERR